MPAIDVVADASVVLKWFHAEGETDVEPARAVLESYVQGAINLSVIDLTKYEVGNALVRGRRLHGGAATAVIDALAAICPVVTPTLVELDVAADLAAVRGLTFYDAAYAAVARTRLGRLVSADRDLVDQGLAVTPAALLTELNG